MIQKRRTKFLTKSPLDQFISVLLAILLWLGVGILIVTLVGLALFDIVRHVLFTIYLWKHL